MCDGCSGLEGQGERECGISITDMVEPGTSLTDQVTLLLMACCMASPASVGTAVFATS